MSIIAPDGITWLIMSSSYQWQLSSIGTTQNCTLQVEIRRTSDSVIIDTCTVYLEAESAA